MSSNLSQHDDVEEVMQRDQVGALQSSHEFDVRHEAQGQEEVNQLNNNEDSESDGEDPLIKILERATISSKQSSNKETLSPRDSNNTSTAAVIPTMVSLQAS